MTVKKIVIISKLEKILLFHAIDVCASTHACITETSMWCSLNLFPINGALSKIAVIPPIFM